MNSRKSQAVKAIIDEFLNARKKTLETVVSMLNIVPEKEVVNIKNFIRSKEVTFESVDLAIEKGLSDSWDEVGQYIKFGINQEKQSQCLVHTR